VYYENGEEVDELDNDRPKISEPQREKSQWVNEELGAINTIMVTSLKRLVTQKIGEPSKLPEKKQKKLVLSKDKFKKDELGDHVKLTFKKAKAEAIKIAEENSKMHDKIS
jgi:hypothetical protein